MEDDLLMPYKTTTKKMGENNQLNLVCNVCLRRVMANSVHYDPTTQSNLEFLNYSHMVGETY